MPRITYGYSLKTHFTIILNINYNYYVNINTYKGSQLTMQVNIKTYKYPYDEY